MVTVIIFYNVRIHFFTWINIVISMGENNIIPYCISQVSYIASATSSIKLLKWIGFLMNFAMQSLSFNSFNTESSTL